MFLKIAGFEFRYQLRNPILWIAVTLFVALVFYITIGPNSLGEGPGIHKNTHFKVGQLYLMLSVLYMFVSAAFVANAVVRDDETRFGPMMRSKPITKFEYLFGRYAGAFCVTQFVQAPLEQIPQRQPVGIRRGHLQDADALRALNGGPRLRAHRPRLRSAPSRRAPAAAPAPRRRRTAAAARPDGAPRPWRPDRTR